MTDQGFVTPDIRRVPAWTVAVAESSHSDWVYIVKGPDGRTLKGYEESLRVYPDRVPMTKQRCVHRLTAVEVNA